MHLAQEKGCSVRDFSAPVTQISLGMGTTVQKLQLKVMTTGITSFLTYLADDLIMAAS